jgi:hypothetical protein
LNATEETPRKDTRKINLSPIILKMYQCVPRNNFHHGTYCCCDRRRRKKGLKKIIKNNEDEMILQHKIL